MCQWRGTMADQNICNSSSPNCTSRDHRHHPFLFRSSNNHLLPILRTKKQTRPTKNKTARSNPTPPPQVQEAVEAVEAVVGAQHVDREAVRPAPRTSQSLQSS